MPHHIFDYSPRPAAWHLFAFVPLAVLMLLFAPDSWAYENGVLENTQMLLLLVSVVLCFTAKSHQSLLRFVATIVLLLLLREVNCGRVLLWSASGEMFHCGPAQDYLKWKHIPHGPLIRTAVYVVGFGLCLFALCRRTTFRQIAAVARAPRVPLWESLLLLVGVLTGIIAEKELNNSMLEEIAEILVYSAISVLIYLYSRKILPDRPQ